MWMHWCVPDPVAPDLVALQAMHTSCEYMQHQFSDTVRQSRQWIYVASVAILHRVVQQAFILFFLLFERACLS